MRVDDCWAYRVFRINGDYEELYDCVESLRTRLAETETGKSVDWDVLLERVGQEKELEIENYLGEKSERQEKGNRRKKRTI